MSNGPLEIVLVRWNLVLVEGLLRVVGSLLRIPELHCEIFPSHLEKVLPFPSVKDDLNKENSLKDRLA